MVTEVWLYGSAARGDADEGSDIDVLVVGDEDFDVESLALGRPDRISQSHYSWAEVEHMANYGSLFLHHIKREGQPVLETEENRLQILLGRLGAYSRADQELKSFRTVLDDVDDSLEGDPSVPFELSVVATAARHAAILGCYLLGEPTFGRSSAFQTLLPRLGYSHQVVDEVIRLYAYRRADDRKRPPDDAPSIKEAVQWVRRIRQLIDEVEGMLA